MEQNLFEDRLYVASKDGACLHPHLIAALVLYGSIHIGTAVDYLVGYNRISPHHVSLA